jgi:pentatricopeptide repeat protein
MNLVQKMPTPRWGSVSPNAFVYSILLTGLGRARRYEAARLLFGALMRRAGLQYDCPGEGSCESLELGAGEEGLGRDGAEELEPLEPELINSVVVGAMIGACQRCGQWEEALRLLRRVVGGELPGVELNTVMLNTCLSALGKAGEWETAGEVYGDHIGLCDRVSRETMIAALGGGGRAREAELMLQDMLERGETPRDYAFCGIIAAYRLSDQ